MNDDQFFGWLKRQGKEQSYAVESHKYGRPADHGVKFDREKKGGKVQRDIDEVEALLDIWAEWMRKPEGPEGYPSKSPGMIHSWIKDFDELVESADAEEIAKINAAFDSLGRSYQDAINRHYGLGAQVWRFGQPATFEDAKIMIRVKFVAKGLL